MDGIILNVNTSVLSQQFVNVTAEYSVVPVFKFKQTVQSSYVVNYV